MEEELVQVEEAEDNEISLLITEVEVTTMMTINLLIYLKIDWSRTEQEEI